MIRQIHYTSCLHGRDGIQGFQVAAATRDIPRRHENLALPLALYRPPQSASPVPGPAEIAALPVALGYRDFGDVAVLFRSHYLGEDYTGRQGNYFAHVLVADDGDLRETPPAAVWESTTWTRGPSDDTGAAGTALPALASIAPGPLVDGSAARAWIDRAPGPFARLLDAVRDAMAGRVKKVVIVADGPHADAEIATAVFAVTAPLPDTLARRVSFTTFTASPAEADLLIVGTTADARLPERRDTIVVALDEPRDQPTSPFTELASHRLREGPAAVAALRALAAEAVPPPGPGDLDAFAAAAGLLDATPDADVLAGLEFVADRLPGRLGADLWTVVEAAVTAGRARPGDDIARWSAVLRRTTGHPPVLTSAYLHAVLTSVASGVDGTDLWLPEVGSEQIDGGGWIGAIVENDPRPEVVATMLAMLRQLGVETADEELGEVVERVLLPVVLDPHGDVTAIRDLPVARRLAAATLARLESRLDDDLIETAAESMSVAAARWLAESASPGTRCALVTAVTLVRAGERDPVLVAAMAVDGPELDRLAGLLWRSPPSAEVGERLVATLDRAVLAASAVPVSLAERLAANAREKRARPVDVELARALDALGSDLPEQARDQVDAVLLTELFRARPRSNPDTRARAVAAASSRADPALAEPLARIVVHWVFACGEALTHAEVLEAAFAAGSTGSSAFLPHYEEQLARTLGAADTEGVLAVLPAVVHLSATSQRAADLLDGACAAALGRRRRAVLDELGQRLSEVGSVPPDLRPGRAVSWTAWWNHYRSSRQSSAGLRDRLLRFGRDG
jgi:GTPase-associated protein 1, N-terminal domain type 2/GTPase-associated protein 1, middle domain